jgi:DNA-binding NtrC family response regulator
MVAIVDDDELMRGALLGMLKSVGLPSQAYASAEEFLKSGQHQEAACLIADIRMPGMLNTAELRQFSSPRTATQKCECRRYEPAQWSFWPNPSTMRCCSKAFERP